MAYVVVVFAMINTAALLAVGWYLREMYRDLPMYVSTAIQDEIRKQDDRIEKRVEKAKGVATDRDGNVTDEAVLAGMRVIPGRPFKR